VRRVEREIETASPQDRTTDNRFWLYMLSENWIGNRFWLYMLSENWIGRSEKKPIIQYILRKNFSNFQIFHKCQKNSEINDFLIPFFVAVFSLIMKGSLSLSNWFEFPSSISIIWTLVVNDIIRVCMIV